jgi:hypothetical protein
MVLIGVNRSAETAMDGGGRVRWDQAHAETGASRIERRIQSVEERRLR